MVKEVTDILIEKLELTNYTVMVPAVFDDLYSGDANFEMACSNTIQPLKLFYSYNVVTHQMAIIFVHACKTPRFPFDMIPTGKQFLDDAKKAVDLL